MKANRKFVKGEEAVSAVIGVILMVAITVAIAATVYVYVSGMLGEGPQVTPNVQFLKDNSAKTLRVSSADPGNLKWNTFNLTWTNGTPPVTFIQIQPITSTIKILWKGSTSAKEYFTQYGDAVVVTAGDVINITGTGTLSLRHTPTNTLVGTYTFS